MGQAHPSTICRSYGGGSVANFVLICYIDKCKSQMKDTQYSTPEVPMIRKESLFLTPEEALEAICLDFRQYNPQIMLFCQIIRLISGGSIVAKREGRKNGAWVNIPGRRTMRWRRLIKPRLSAIVRCNLYTQLNFNCC